MELVKHSKAETANAAPIQLNRGSGASLQPVLGDLAGDGVAVQTQHLRGFADVAAGALQCAQDAHLLELFSGVVVVQALVEHVLYELLELVPHGYASSRSDNRRNASTYLS